MPLICNEFLVEANTSHVGKPLSGTRLTGEIHLAYYQWVFLQHVACLRDLAGNDFRLADLVD